MSELIEALILGIVQGLTEFLPVSSSGHLEIMKYLLNDDSLAKQSMMTTVILHFATALATMVVFRKDIVDILKGLFSKSDTDSKPFVGYIILSMIPAVIIGLAFDDIIEQFFHKKIVLVSFMLIVTGLLLLLSERMKTSDKPLSPLRAIIIGLAQAIAITPGISRSGATISTALILGISRSQAARFSFLMVIPLIFGKIAKDLLAGDFTAAISAGSSLSSMLVGFLAAFFTGILACKLMIRIVNKAKLSWFAIYCFIVGLGLIIYVQFL